MEYNQKHGITPQTVVKPVRDIIEATKSLEEKTPSRSRVQIEAGNGRKKMDRRELRSLIKRLEKEMREAAKRLEFERAAELRDAILELKLQAG
jgi:excinuclease ABC subunit B